MISDPIGDMIARIKNAQNARHKKVVMPYSKLKKEILDILVSARYVDTFKIVEEDGLQFISVNLKYNQRDPFIQHFRRISKPGLRIYRAATDLTKPLNGYGTGIISTSQGVMTVSDAKSKGIGGELLCEIW